MNEQRKTIVIIHPDPRVLYSFELFLKEYLIGTPFDKKYVFRSCPPKAGIRMVRKGGVDLVITNAGEGTDEEPEHYMKTLTKIKGYTGLPLVMTSRENDLPTIDAKVREQGLAIGAISSLKVLVYPEIFARGVNELVTEGHSQILDCLYGQPDWENAQLKRVLTYDLIALLKRQLLVKGQPFEVQIT